MADRRENNELPLTVTIRSDPLADAGLLSQLEADVYVYRAIESMDGEEVARQMGLSPSEVDESLKRAREKIQQADETVELVKKYSDMFNHAETIYSDG